MSLIGADRVPAEGAAAALCEIVNVVPAIVSVAVRAAPLLAATAKVTVPLPLPDAAGGNHDERHAARCGPVHPVPAVMGTIRCRLAAKTWRR